MAEANGKHTVLSNRDAKEHVNIQYEQICFLWSFVKYAIDSGYLQVIATYFT